MNFDFFSIFLQNNPTNYYLCRTKSPKLNYKSLKFKDMKKLSLAIAAVIVGFVMASCNSVSPVETIKKATDEFFAQAETKIQAVTSGEEFMQAFAEMNEARNEFMEKTFADYLDEEGNVKGFTEEEWNDLQSYMFDRATAYNKIEGAKAGEFMEPVVADYENAINALCEGFGNVDQEAFENLTLDFDKAETALRLFADYDNVPTALQERAQAAEDKLDELLKLMAQ